jgi:hypothetical protein
MVFPAVTRPQNGPGPDAHSSEPHTTVSTLSLRPPAGPPDPMIEFEACLAEVRLLELGLGPSAGEHWATRYWAAVEARGAEAASHWRRQMLMAALHTSLVIAVLAVVSSGVAPIPAVSATAVLGLGLAAAWMLAARSTTRRLAEWDTRLESLEAAAPASDPSSGVAASIPPAATGGTVLLIVVFAAFWVVAAVVSIVAPHLLMGPRLP